MKLKDVAFAAAMYHKGKVFYVGSGIGEDIPVNEGRYLVMVNGSGDRVAHCSPGKEWQIDEVSIKNYCPEMPKFKNAKKIVLGPMENI